MHLTALWAYGVAQPVFSFVDGNPELLALRGATQAEVIAFAVVLAVAPPLLATAYAWLASRASQWVGDVLFLAFLGVFSAPVALQLVRLADPSELPALLAVPALIIAGVIGYTRWRAVRLFLGFSLLLPILGFAAFLRGAPVAADDALAAHAQAASPAPVVFVILDEFPVSALVTRTGEIDAVRYPNFARLARDGTWYSNATTVHDRTEQAVPAILTGRRSPAATLPVVADHPENLFSLLGGTYALDVHETASDLCGRRLCPRERDFAVNRIGFLLANIGTLYLKSEVFRASQNSAWGAFDDYRVPRSDRFEAFVRGLSRDESSRMRTLHFLHVLLPHAPYEFLPSGHAYRPAELFAGQTWGHDSWLALQGYQRHLLQVAYTDAMIGKLIRQLEGAGLYDPALLVVVADHGASFRAGDGRRPITETNFSDIANIPLFVKYPHQDDGGTDGRAARTVDIVPTIADVLDIRLPWRVDGTSLLAASPARPAAVVGRMDGTNVRASMETVKLQTLATVAQKELHFGRGRDSLYRIGVNRDLIGSVAPPALPRARTIRVGLEGESALLETRSSAELIPVMISGVVEEGRIDHDVELAVAVNGRIRALTRCFELEDAIQRFRAMVPESALRDGMNKVDVFAIYAQGAQRRLVRLGGIPAVTG